jgi:hypothetical protein
LANPEKLEMIIARHMPLRLLLPDRRIVAASELPKTGGPGDREKRTRNHSLPDPLGLPINPKGPRRQLERLNAKR